MDKSFNENFNKLKRTGLFYLPWIGDNFTNSKTKLLVLGESNYNGPEGWAQLRKWNQILVNQNFATLTYEPYKLLINLSKALHNERDVSSDKKYNFKLAHYIAFSNIVQRPLKNVNDRPKKDDFINGWKIILNIIKIIKPKNLIIIGVSSIKILLNIADDVNVKIIKPKKNKNKINGIFPIKFLLQIQNENINCIAIKHTSSYFNWHDWHKYIRKNINLQEIV